MTRALPIELLIHALVTDAFGREVEADLVDTLRRDGDLVLSLVAEIGGVIGGHIALSKLTSPVGALALAPISVAPHLQRQGVGSALVTAALERAAGLGYAIVFVLGDPRYYARFGFSTDTAEQFDCEFAGPFFMARWLSDAHATGTAVVYPAAFAGLD